MIVCTSHAKVGHRQAPYAVNKNPQNESDGGFCFGTSHRCNGSGAPIPVEFAPYLIILGIMLNIKRYTTTQADFRAALEQLLAFEGAQDSAIETTVADILSAVK